MFVEKSNNNKAIIPVHWFNNHESIYIKPNVTVFKLGSGRSSQIVIRMRQRREVMWSVE